jgi:radical SAM protein with 4Fe4S-binding SPASM domain
MMGQTGHIPRHLLLQWHLTERCNLRCAHCYQEGYAGQELCFSEWEDLVGQYSDLLATWRARTGTRRPTGHITVTGGEPFVHDDSMRLLELLARHRDSFTFAILTNGLLIDGTLAQTLARLSPAFVQVSIEGTEETHDRIRGPGTHAKAVEALRRLKAAGLRTLLSFTAHRGNAADFPEVARLGRRLGVDRVWADRLVPQGSGAALRHQALTPGETRRFLESMAVARADAQRAWFGRTEVAMHRALQFLVADATPYQCTAGESLITVLPDGAVVPCRRMPVTAGNLRRTSLREVYERSPVMLGLRDRDRVSAGCESCAFERLCRGGLRCLAAAMTGDPFRADPGCWLASGSQVAPELDLHQDSLPTYPQHSPLFTANELNEQTLT